MSDVSESYFAADDLTTVKEKALSGSLYTAFGQIGRIAVSFVSQIFLSRLLTPADFGLIAMTGVFMALVDLFSTLGISQSVIQKESISQDDLSTLYWFGLAASLGCMLTVMAASPFVAALYGEPRVTAIMVALACQMPVSAVAGHASALMARKMRFAAISLIDLISAITNTAVSITAALAGASYWALVLGSLAGGAMRAGLDRFVSGWRPSRPRWSRSAAPMLRFGRDMTTFNFISFVSSYLDNLLIGALKSASDVGLFDRSFTLVIRPLGSLTAPVGRVAVPLLARLHSEHSEYRASFLVMFDALQLLLLPGLMIAVVLSNDVVSILLGSKWLAIAPMFSAISIAAAFVPLSSAGTWLLTSQGRVGEQVKAALFSSGAIVVSLLIGLRWGIVGVSIAYAAFAPFVHGIYTIVAGRRGPVSINCILIACTPGLLSALIACGVLRLIRNNFDDPLLRCCLGGTLSYMVSSLVFLAFPRSRRACLAALRLLWLKISFRAGAFGPPNNRTTPGLGDRPGPL